MEYLMFQNLNAVSYMWKYYPIQNISDKKMR